MPDISVRPIAWAALAIALTVAGVVALVLLALHASGVAPGGERFGGGDANPADAPGLSSAPQPNLAAGKREKEARLHSSGWIDRQAGIAHISIDDAMALSIAERAKK